MSIRDRLEKAATAVDIFPELSNAQKETNRLVVQIANQIYNRRKELGKTQIQLADSLNIKQPMVCQWESGDCNFTISTLAEIFDALGLKINITFSNTNECRFSTHPNYIQNSSESQDDHAFSVEPFSEAA